MKYVQKFICAKILGESASLTEICPPMYLSMPMGDPIDDKRDRM